MSSSHIKLHYHKNARWLLCVPPALDLKKDHLRSPHIVLDLRNFYDSRNQQPLVPYIAFPRWLFKQYAMCVSFWSS